MDEKFFRYIIILFFAFIAELVDGGIGMGYGVTLNSLLVFIGIGTVMASASVHISEIFVSFFSGVSHFRAGNFDWKIFIYLTIPGIFGGIIGAYAAVRFQNSPFVVLLVASILLLLGFLIILRHIRKKDILEQEYRTPRIRHLLPLGFVASFIDAIGGGGWGPISTPTLILNNADPKKAIGAVNFAEFFVTLAISMTFLMTVSRIEWGFITFLVIGGMIAAPISAKITKMLSHKTVAIMVGCLIITLSLGTIFKTIDISFLF